MHTHISALSLAVVFLGVAIIGGLWRLLAAWLVTRGGVAASFGEAMAFQF